MDAVAGSSTPSKSQNACKACGIAYILKQTHPSSQRWTLSQAAPLVRAKMSVKPPEMNGFEGKRTPATSDGRSRKQHPRVKKPKCVLTIWESIDLETTAPQQPAMDAVAGSTPSESQNVCKTNRKAWIWNQTHPSNQRWTQPHTAPLVRTRNASKTDGKV